MLNKSSQKIVEALQGGGLMPRDIMKWADLTQSSVNYNSYNMVADGLLLKSKERKLVKFYLPKHESERDREDALAVKQNQAARYENSRRDKDHNSICGDMALRVGRIMAGV